MTWNHVLHRIAAIVMLLLAAGSLEARAESYSVVDLGTLGGSFSSAYGINSLGQVTGLSVTSGNLETHIFLYDRAMHDLGALGDQYSYGTGINSAGQIIGTAFLSANATYHIAYYDGALHDLGSGLGLAINESGVATGTSEFSGEVHAIRADGSLHDLGTLGGTFSRGWSINATGEVVGESYTTGDATTHAFLYDGTMHDLGTLGGTYSIAYGINDSGAVTGAASLNQFEEHAFLYDGTMHDLGTLGDGSTGEAINAAGQIVGDFHVPNTAFSHAFLYSGDQMVDLNDLISPTSGWQLQDATAINDSGWIVGYGSVGEYTQHAFLLVPVPEPSSMHLSIVALIAFALWRRRSSSHLTLTQTCQVSYKRSAQNQA